MYRHISRIYGVRVVQSINPNLLQQSSFWEQIAIKKGFFLKKI